MFLCNSSGMLTHTIYIDVGIDIKFLGRQRLDVECARGVVPGECESQNEWRRLVTSVARLGEAMFNRDNLGFSSMPLFQC